MALQVEIDEVVATIRVRDNQGARDHQADRHIVEAVLRALDAREGRGRRQSDATLIPDDGRGGIDRSGGAM